MKAQLALPLNEAQQRRLTVALASLERLLAELRSRLERPCTDLRLTRYEDRLEPDEAAALLPMICQVELRLRQMADELGLEPLSDSVRRGLVAGLELAAIHLYECRPTSGLTGCGAVAAPTAAYLEQQLPDLEAQVRRLALGLSQARSVSKLEAESHG